LLKSLFKNNPVRDSVAGTVKSVETITADTLYACHKAFYAPSNMALCIVGDVEYMMVYDTVMKILPEKPGDTPFRDYGKSETLLPKVFEVRKSMDVSLPIFLAGCKVNTAARGDDTLKLEIVSALALEMLFGHSSPFYLRLYAEGLINADFSYSFDSAAGIAYTMYGGETRDPRRVFSEIKDQIQRTLTHDPDTALFERIKKAAIGSYIRALNSFGVIASSIIEGHFRGYDSLQAPMLLTNISVDDIMDFIRNNLLPENMAISTINPK
jgi:predicted Zn-dependent peptidase